MLDEKERAAFAGALQAQLNRHGIAFQYRALKAAEDACRNGAPWLFETSEHPVQLRGKPTHIDFVLRNRRLPLYLVCECKRVNPAFNTWYFLKAPYTRRDALPSDICFLDEITKKKNEGSFLNGPAVHALPGEAFFDVAVVAKNNANKGDPAPKDSSDAISNAASQVCMGVSGLLNQWASRAPAEEPVSLYVLPAIFTTARLISTTEELANANLETGDINVNPDLFCEQPWIFFQYLRSPGISPTMSSLPLRDNPPRSPSICERAHVRLGDYRDVCFLRTVAIVSAPNIAAFLTRHTFRWEGIEHPDCIQDSPTRRTDDPT